MVISEWDDEWRIPIHHPGSVGNDNRRRGRAGRNPAERNPSAQEMKDGPGKRNTDRRRANEDRDPEWKEG
jgi:hypothetical protein